MSYYVIFKPEGRLGNALFRYVASSIICQKFNMKYILLEDFNKNENIIDKHNMYIVNDNNYIEFIDKGRNNYVFNKHILMTGYYQFDFILTYFKKDVLDFIDKTRDENHDIQVDMNGGHRKYKINELLYEEKEEKEINYETVIHLRLGDIFRSNQFDYISPEYLQKVYEKEKDNFAKSKGIALVVENKTNKDELEVISKHISWFKDRNLVISLESNDIITDFKLFKNCKTLICSYSTLSWMAAFFSNKIKKCYIPNYNFFKERRICYFRNPIENTILYDVYSTKLKDTKVYIITLEKYPERSEKLHNLISCLCKVGLKVEFFKGVDGNEVSIKNTQYDFIKMLEYKSQNYIYDKRLRLNGQPMKKGEIGCALSHVLLYKKLKEDKEYVNYIILEDDVDLDVDLETFYNTLMNIPNKFDLLHISKSDWYPFEKEDNDKINGIFYKPKKKFFNRTTGYIISKQGCEKLIDVIKGNIISIPSDDLISNTYIKSNDFMLYFPEKYVFKERDDAKSIIGQINNS
jgi:GR25 family glycosyltransferase involved in LPS biosynthesis